MKKTSLSNLIEEMSLQENERAQDQYVSVNLRPGDKSAAMLNVISVLTGQTASVIINRSLSEKMASSIPQFCDDYNFLLDVIEATLREYSEIPSGSALAHAKEMGFFSITTSDRLG